MVAPFIRWVACAFVITSGSPTLPAADLSAPVHRVDGSFVREWLVLGPFPSPEMETDFLADVGGEANVRPKEGDAVTTKDGTRLIWTRLRSETDVVGFRRAMALGNPSIIYAYCELSCIAPMETGLGIFDSGRADLWLNGKKLDSLPSSINRHSQAFLPTRPIRLKAGSNSCLVKLNSPNGFWAFGFQPLPREHANVALQVSDSAGKPAADAVVWFYVGGERFGFIATDASGGVRLDLYPLAKTYDLQITAGDEGTWLHDVRFKPGESRQMAVRLTNAVSLTGKTLAMDSSPQNAITVQAIWESAKQSGDGSSPFLSRERTGDKPSLLQFPGATSDGKTHSLLPLPPYSATVLSDTNGNFRFINLRPGQYRLRCHGPDGYVYPETPGGTNLSTPALINVEPGRTLTEIRFVFPEAKKGVWKNYRVTQGLRDLPVTAIDRTPDGMLWAGAYESFLYAYNGVEFTLAGSQPEIPGSWIETIAHSADGTLWIGTRNGLSRRAHGKTEELSSAEIPAAKTVHDIQVDPDGMVWFATESGLYKYDGKRVVAFTTDEGLVDTAVRSIMRMRDGHWLLGSAFGLVRFDGTSFVLVRPFPGRGLLFVEKPLQSQDSAVWFCTGPNSLGGDQGAYRYDGKSLLHLGEDEGLASEIVNDIAETSDGKLWFGTRKGLSRFDGTTFLNYTKADGLDGEVFQIHVDSDDVLWCATGDGVSRYDPKGFTRFTKRDGLVNTGGGTANVLHFEPDPKGGLLVGTEWGGLFHTDSQKIWHVPSIIAQYYVRPISRAGDGSIWFGGAFGIAKLEGDRWTNVLRPDWVIALCNDDEGNLWYGHGWNGGGVSRYNLNTRASATFTSAQGLPDDQVWSIQKAVGGGVWIGTSSGLARYRNGQIEDWREKLGVLTGAVFNLRRDSDNTLWISSRKGLHRLELARDLGSTGYQPTAIELRILKPTPTRNPNLTLTRKALAPKGSGLGLRLGVRKPWIELSLNSTPVGYQPVPSGNLPDGTAGALSGNAGVHSVTSAPTIPAGKSPDGAGKLPALPKDGVADSLVDGFRLISLTTTNGLPDDTIWCSARTRDGKIWMGTDHNGLVGYDGRAVTTIDKREGLLGNQPFTLATNADDSLWIGFLDGGLMRYQPTKSRPTVRLSGVQSEGRKLTNYSKPTEVEIDRKITIEYSEIDLKTLPEKRQFWYRLAKRSGETVIAGVTKDRRFEWTPEGRGQYRFEVQAIDRDLNYSEPARVSFQVKVPWYLNAWILAPGAGSFGGLLIWAFIARALFRRKTREAARLQEQMLQQERQAREALEKSHQEVAKSNRSLAEAKELAEAAKKAAEVANRAKSTFLANMSHEIRTPLNAVLGYAQILMRDRGLGDDQRQSAATIERSGSHLLKLINEILDLSKIEAGAMELAEADFDLARLIDDLSAMFEPKCNEKGLRFRVEWLVEEGRGLATENAENAKKETMGEPSQRSLRLGSMFVRGDEGKLRQVLINLLGNAVKFTGSGAVTLRVARKSGGTGDPPVPVGDPPTGMGEASKPAARVVRDASTIPSGESPGGTGRSPLPPTLGLPLSTFFFEIEDTGPGIPAAVREKIFEPFTQADEGKRKGGTGLGLTIARRQIELMGGRLGLESDVGRGSRFFFTLEFAAGAGEFGNETESREQRVRQLASGTLVRALVADDVRENRDILSRFLGELGAEVTVVEDGEKALAQLQAGRFEIAFLDIRMPKLTGLQVAQAALGESGLGKTKLVAVSASVLTHERQLYEESGFDDFLPKPFRFGQVCDCLVRLLGVSYETEVLASAADRDSRGAQREDDQSTRTIKEKGEQPRTLASGGASTDFDPGLAERCPLRILVADDVEANRNLVQRVLQGFGYDCEFAADGRQAIEAMERRPFDLLLLDIHMPVMDGFEAARRIRERWIDRERPWLVASTASTTLDCRTKCLESGMDDFIAKPIEIGEIRRVLEEAREWVQHRHQKPAESESPIDWLRLNRMFVDANHKMAEFLKSYVETTSSQIRQIRAAIDAGDADEVEVLSHRCGGASANFGIRSMVGPMVQLEKLARSKNLLRAPQLLSEAERVFSCVREIIRERSETQS